MANALVALGTSARSVTTDLGVDVLSFGATKNGTLNTEAIVVFRKQIAEELRYRLRRAGQVWSKMRYSAAQLNDYIEAGLWLRLATQANSAAKRLSQGLSQVPGIRMIERVEMNLLFMRMPEKSVAGRVGLHKSAGDDEVERAVSPVLVELRSMGCWPSPGAMKRLRRVLVDHPERRECGRQAMAAGGRKSREARLSKQLMQST